MKYICSFFIILSIILCYIVHSQHNQLSISEQNYKASTDTIKSLRLENDHLLYEKSVYILNEKDLCDRLDITSKELKDIKKKLDSSLSYISEIEMEVNREIKDTIYLERNNNFSYKDDWLYMSGNVNTDKLTIHNITFPLNLTTGLTNDNNIFVTTDNPYAQIKDIKGAKLTESKSPSFKHEVVLGVGVQYGLFNRQFDFGPSISYGFIVEF